MFVVVYKFHENTKPTYTLIIHYYSIYLEFVYKQHTPFRYLALFLIWHFSDLDMGYDNIILVLGAFFMHLSWGFYSSL